MMIYIVHESCRRLESYPLAKRAKHQSMDARLKEAQAMAAKRHSESAQEREDRRQKDAQAKTVKCQSVDMRLKEAQAKAAKRDSECV